MATLINLERIKTKAKANDDNLIVVLSKIKDIINTTNEQHEARNAQLSGDIERLTQQQNETGQSNSERIEALTTELAAEKLKTDGADAIITQIEVILDSTNEQLQATKGDPYKLESNSFVNYPAPAEQNQEPRRGGKSTKRKRHNKKHSKGKSRKIRNKKHKSK